MKLWRSPVPPAQIMVSAARSRTQANPKRTIRRCLVQSRPNPPPAGSSSTSSRSGRPQPTLFSSAIPACSKITAPLFPATWNVDLAKKEKRLLCKARARLMRPMLLGRLTRAEAPGFVSAHLGPGSPRRRFPDKVPLRNQLRVLEGPVVSLSNPRLKTGPD